MALFFAKISSSILGGNGPSKFYFKEDFKMVETKLGKVNGFLYGILITVSIIMMIVYIIWLIKECFELDDDMSAKWKKFKGNVQDKWTDMKDWCASKRGGN